MEKQEQLTTSNEVSKIHLPNKELVGLKKSKPKEVTKETTKLPKPTGWRLLILPFRMKEKTDAGLLIGTETIDRQQVASQCGNVIAMGTLVTRIKNDIQMVRGARSVIGWSLLVMQDHVSKLKVEKFVF